jgi:hypothetical protein
LYKYFEIQSSFKKNKIMKQVIITYKSEHTFRERMLLWLLGKIIPVHAKFYTRRKPWGLSSGDMLQYPEGSLGRDLGTFLKTEKIEPIDRVERHDAFHILLGFTTHVTEEAAMQFFLIGNGKLSPFTLGTALFAGLMLPEHWVYFRRQYHRGRQARSIAKWDFKSLLGESTDELRAFIFYRPVQNKTLEDKLLSFEKTKSIENKLLKSIRRTTAVFIICLVLSGITAFPLVTETHWMMRHLSLFPGFLQSWIIQVSDAVQQTPGIVLYGTDWLAFAHIIIALFFVGVYRDPVRNQFTIVVGMIACCAVFPLAFTCGPVRGIPFFHQLIDCGFGVIGLIPLGLVYKKIKVMERQQSPQHLSA